MQSSAIKSAAVLLVLVSLSRASLATIKPEVTSPGSLLDQDRLICPGKRYKRLMGIKSIDGVDDLDLVCRRACGTEGLSYAGQGFHRPAEGSLGLQCCCKRPLSDPTTGGRAGMDVKR